MSTLRTLRLRQIVALLLIGDRVMDFIRTNRQAGLLRRRSVPQRMLQFVKQNRTTLALGAAELATGWWWASRKRAAKRA